jgi:anti-sigma B factor antagonist
VYGSLDSIDGGGKLGTWYRPLSRSLPNKAVVIMKTQTERSESFRVERHGDIAVIIPASHVFNMDDTLIQQASEIVLAPLRKEPPGGIVVDLSEVKYFASVFIQFLLKCHMLVKKHGSELVLSGASDPVRELLHQTALDTLWALYATRAEAMEALGGSD